ncbi:four-helix bundle copper-binding protein [Paenibacillus polysaccharolyticus]|uniref:four-helix bundle copper-binding protein n=1 Tax=Paenibacillus polysaccharolyticus TaxID=582692 RepID=UPI00280B0280|nr:four-helix bundle copper-binding protein [Paenibacillus polysaccharolyticus]
MTQQQYQQCIDACLECMNACNVCYISSLKEYDLAKLRDCIRMNRECADICAFAAQAMTRGSDFIGEICELCVKACEACAAECGKHAHDHCQACAEACRRCAEACRLMSAVA